MPESSFVYHDGGREAAGYIGHTGDCVTRSIAIATGQPYKEVYDTLFDLARNTRKYMAKLELQYGANARNHISPRTGMPREVYEPYLRSLGWTWVPTMQVGQGCQVHLKADELPTGRLVVRVSKHMTAVVDGVIHDTYNPSRGGERCVYGYFTATPDVAPAVTRTRAPARYHIALRGETNLARFESGVDWYEADEAAAILGDLTGYLPEYVKKTVLRKVSRGQTAILKHGLGSVRFHITREGS